MNIIMIVTCMDGYLTIVALDSLGVLCGCLQHQLM